MALDRKKLVKQLDTLLDSNVDWPHYMFGADAAGPSRETKTLTMRELLQVDASSPDDTVISNTFHAQIDATHAARNRALKEAESLAGGADISALTAFWDGAYPERDRLDKEIRRLQMEELELGAPVFNSPLSTQIFSHRTP